MITIKHSFCNLCACCYSCCCLSFCFACCNYNFVIAVKVIKCYISTCCFWCFLSFYNDTCWVEVIIFVVWCLSSIVCWCWNCNIIIIWCYCKYSTLNCCITLNSYYKVVWAVSICVWSCYLCKNVAISIRFVNCQVITDIFIVVCEFNITNWCTIVLFNLSNQILEVDCCTVISSCRSTAYCNLCSLNFTNC